MSEELQSKYFKNGRIIGQKIGEFEYFQIGATTFNQLKISNIIPNQFNKAFDSYKPDRLIVDRRGSEPIVITVIEDKENGKFNSELEKIRAIQQCNTYCQEIGAKIGVITDGAIAIWINPLEANEDTEYTDKITGKKRSYTLVKKEDGAEIIRNFQIDEKHDLLNLEKMSDETRKTYKLINEINLRINSKNSIIKEPERIDPLPLARRVWQDIWIATGKSPEKCLYNVVELFIFKFLSDLKILTYPNDFDSLYELVDKGNSIEDILKYYVKNCRENIKSKFPVSKDNTTIINGTIFVDENGNANITQASLFKESLNKFKDFEKEFGKFSTHNIDKDFKTKLYEAFLKQTAGLKALGQFFTPRKVIRSIVQMSGIANFSGGERFCDPFCGVGGFVLEPLNLPERADDFRPKNGKIIPPFIYKGYDKGFEKDEERTIILAKANMLIYLAEIIAETKLTKEFAEKFNETFTLWRSNLGTLGEITHEEDKKFNLILTNPPYVKRGIKSLKNAILENSDLRNFYTVNGGGLEGLALEWIVRHLKKSGKAFIVIPDGILNRLDDKKLRKFILQECYLEGIISLPQKTFYATPKKTYILAITKKDSFEKKQSFPVYTYLVSNIGETLDINRFETPEKNDLPEMIDLFGEFQVYKLKDKVKEIENKSLRCKIQPIEKFDPEKSWCVDRWWTQEEKVNLGIEKEIEVLSPEEFFEKLQNTKKTFEITLNEFGEILKKKSEKHKKIKFKSIKINELFDFPETNSGITKAFCNDNKGSIPVYASSKDEKSTLGFIGDNISGVKYYGNCLSWNRNGSVGYVFIRNHRFATNEDHRAMILKKEKESLLDKSYLKFEIERELFINGFSFLDKCGISKIQKVLINIPVNQTGEFDLGLQTEVLRKNLELVELQEKIRNLENETRELGVDFLEEFEYREELLSELFEIKQGNSFYTKKRVLGNNWRGNIPVYSSNTKEDGLLMKMDLSKIKKEDRYHQYCLTWSVDGYAGTIFIRNKKNIENVEKEEFYFTINNHCGILLPKYKKLYLPFIKWVIQPVFYGKSKGYGNNKVGTNQIKDILVKIPIDKKNEFDLDKQKEITQKYEKVEELKEELIERLELLANYKISLE